LDTLRILPVLCKQVVIALIKRTILKFEANVDSSPDILSIEHPSPHNFPGILWEDLYHLYF
jgi:hypothetical protein